MLNKSPRWASKVSRAKIRLLYEGDAQGILDPELVDEVGWVLWERCESILIVTAAHNGHVLCPACGAGIERRNAWSVDETVECTRCGWIIPWAAYHQSYRSKQLFGANATGIFETYHQVFPHAQAAKEKMVLIDQLIHAFHVDLKEKVGRPAAANLIEGSLKDVIHFLDKLTSGDASSAGIGGSRAAWKQTLTSADWSREFIENEGDGEEESLLRGK